MSQNSSISVSRPGRLLALVLALPLLVIAVTAGIQFWALKLGVDGHEYGRVIRYQQEKLEQLTSLDIAFIGDSSLGNAISAADWEQQTDNKAANLALLGFFGYEGGLRMVRQTLRAHKPKRIVLMYNMLLARQTEDLERLGGILVSDRPILDGSLNGKSLQVLARAFLNGKSLRKNARRIWHHYAGRHEKTGRAIEDDFIIQYSIADADQKRKEAAALDLDPTGINQRHYSALREIAELCRESGIQCDYLHGPVFEAFCADADLYFEAQNQLIRETGLTLVEERPLCFGAEDMGDSENHIRPDLRSRYTKYYIEFLGSIN